MQRKGKGKQKLVLAFSLPSSEELFSDRWGWSKSRLLLEEIGNCGFDTVRKLSKMKIS